MNISEIEELKRLYTEVSKHSNYQILSKRLSLLLTNNEIKVKTRYEEERLKYILKNISIKNKKVLDIGGNTGYFTFEFLDYEAKLVHYYEGNKTHADFVRLASSILGVEKRIEITDRYFSFEDELKNERYDIVLLLNVLHHIGDDYGDKELSIDMAKQLIIKELKSFTGKTDFMFFQLGFNWKGNRNLGLFKDGTKTEMIDFITQGTKDFCDIVKIGIPEKEDKGVKYFDQHASNIGRNDELGEFLNRPLFIIKFRN